MVISSVGILFLLVLGFVFLLLIVLTVVLVVKFTSTSSSPGEQTREANRHRGHQDMRVEELEEENRRLREEIARLTKGPTSEGFTP